MTQIDDFETVELASAAALRDWLSANHARANGIWLVTFKRYVAGKYVSTGEVLDVLLCFGWIDGRRRKVDDDRTLQLISPRRTRAWARSYKARAARLIAEGRMAAPGLRAIADGRARGLWSFMDDVDALIVPDDLQAGLDATPGAAAWFADAAPSYRRNILRWIKLAKAPATRAKRVAATVAASADARKLPQM